MAEIVSWPYLVGGAHDGEAHHYGDLNGFRSDAAFAEPVADRGAEVYGLVKILLVTEELAVRMLVVLSGPDSQPLPEPVREQLAQRAIVAPFLAKLKEAEGG